MGSIRRTSSATALRELPYEWVGAILAGGSEKLREGEGFGLPLLDGFGEAEVVVDLSDAPVLGPNERFRWASRALAAGLGYIGADFRFDPPEYEEVAVPSIAVIGTGKRVGKTARLRASCAASRLGPRARRRHDGARWAAGARVDRATHPTWRRLSPFPARAVTPPPTISRSRSSAACPPSAAGAPAGVSPGARSSRMSATVLVLRSNAGRS